MKTFFLSLLVVTLVGLVLPVASAQAQIGGSTDSEVQHDDRVKKLLDATGLKYEIDEDGDFKLLFEYDDGRSHIVFVNSKTETYQGMEIREIWAVGFVTPEDGLTVPSEVSENLIRANAEAKLGAWQVQKMGDKEVGVFLAMISAEAGEKIVLDTLRLVGITADEKESELLETDDL